MASQNLDEPLDGKGIRELEIVIKELQCLNRMNVKYLLNYHEENNTTSKILSDKQIIESVMGNDREDEVKDDSSTMELVSHKEALNLIMTLNNFLLQYENTTLKLFFCFMKN